jgi:hypothetical protein
VQQATAAGGLLLFGATKIRPVSGAMVPRIMRGQAGLRGLEVRRAAIPLFSGPRFGKNISRNSLTNAKLEVTLVPTLIRFRSGEHDDRCTSTAFAAFLSPDGKHIAALMPVGTAEAQNAQSHVIFLENFSDELAARSRSASNCDRA